MNFASSVGKLQVHVLKTYRWYFENEGHSTASDPRLFDGSDDMKNIREVRLELHL